MIEMSEDFFKKLADRLGMTVEQVYNIYTVGVKKTALLNIMSVGVVLLGIILISILSVGVIASANENDDSTWRNSTTRTSIDKFNGDDYFTLAISVFLVSIVWCFIIGIIMDSVGEYLLPEYNAIRTLISDLS